MKGLLLYNAVTQFYIRVYLKILQTYIIHVSCN